MSHPFFDAVTFPHHRLDARELHKSLYQTLGSPAQIDLLYRKCAEGLMPLTPGAPPNVMWAEALDKLTAARALPKLFELVLADASLAAIHSKVHAARDAIDAVQQMFLRGDTLFLDRVNFRDALDRLRDAAGRERVLLIRGGPRSGKTWSKRMVEDVARESGAGTIYVAEGLVIGVDDMVDHLFSSLGKPDAIPPRTTTDDAWYKQVCRKLLGVVQGSGTPRWIIADDLGLVDGAPRLDPQIKAFFDQLALFMANEAHRAWLRLVLIDYPPGKQPTLWKNIDVLNDQTSEADVDAACVAEYLLLWARGKGWSLARDEAEKLASEVIAHADAQVAKGPNEDDEPLVRLRIIHDKVRKVVKMLAPGAP
jgi:hypothetical protein